MPSNHLRNLFLILFAWICVAPASQLSAQESTDSSEKQQWSGVLDVGVGKLTLNFDLIKVGDEWEGKIISIEQGNAVIPISKIEIDGNNMAIEANSVQAKFAGKLNADETVCTGKWTQLGKEYEFEIRRVDSEHIETWKGTLEMGVKLEIGLKVYRGKDDVLTAKMDSYSQGVTDIPVEFQRDGDTVKFSQEAMRMSFEGNVDAEALTVTGTFTQAGIKVPLKLEKVELDYAPEMNRPQTPVAPFPYNSTEVSYENSVDSVTLAGTLTTPKGDGPFAVAILISGSGPQDRNEEIMGHKPFLVIADYLSRHGIAVLRFDDRGVGKSTGNFTTANSADFANDVRAGVEFLKQQPEIDAARIGLIGHSEGGLIAPMVAAESDDLGFIVLMAGPGVDGGTILKSQTDAILKAANESEAMRTANRELYDAILPVCRQEQPVSAEQIKEAARSSVNKIEDGKVREEMQASVDALGEMLSSPWMQFFIKYNPGENLRSTKCPVLAINGEKDLQVLVELNLNAI